MRQIGNLFVSTSRSILGKVVNFSGRQFTHLSKGENGTYRIGLFGGWMRRSPFPQQRDEYIWPGGECCDTDRAGLHAWHLLSRWPACGPSALCPQWFNLWLPSRPHSCCVTYVQGNIRQQLEKEQGLPPWPDVERWSTPLWMGWRTTRMVEG